MRCKLLKSLRRNGKNQITIYSTTTTLQSGNEIITGMEIGFNDSSYRGLFSFGDTCEDVYRKAERIYIQAYINRKRKRKE